MHDIRSKKDPIEIELMQQACNITEKGHCLHCGADIDQLTEVWNNVYFSARQVRSH